MKGFFLTRRPHTYVYLTLVPEILRSLSTFSLAKDGTLQFDNNG